MVGELRMDKKGKEFFEKELIWKYPILWIPMIISVKILQYLDNTRPDPSLLVGIMALFVILLLVGITILGVLWIWFSVIPLMFKILRSTQR